MNQSFINAPTLLTLGWQWIVGTSTGHNHVTNTIGRADLDGQNVNHNFITGASCP